MASLSKQSLSQMDRPTFMVVFGQAIDNFMQIEKMLPVNARYYDYQILQENWNMMHKVITTSTRVKNNFYHFFFTSRINNEMVLNAVC